MGDYSRSKSPAVQVMKLSEATSRRGKIILKNVSPAAKCARSWRKRYGSFHQTFGKYACCAMCCSTPRTKVPGGCGIPRSPRSEEHTSELQSQSNIVCRLLLAN